MTGTLWPVGQAVIINPGTGVVPRARKRLAEANLRAFLRELPGVSLSGGLSPDGTGRWDVTLRRGRRYVRVSIPGCPRAALVRPREVGLLVPVRLYVDGNSWYWPHALAMARHALGIPEQG